MKTEITRTADKISEQTRDYVLNEICSRVKHFPRLEVNYGITQQIWDPINDLKTQIFNSLGVCIPVHKLRGTYEQHQGKNRR